MDHTSIRSGYGMVQIWQGRYLIPIWYDSYPVSWSPYRLRAFLYLVVSFLPQGGYVHISLSLFTSHWGRLHAQSRASFTFLPQLAYSSRDRLYRLVLFTSRFYSFSDTLPALSLQYLIVTHSRFCSLLHHFLTLNRTKRTTFISKMIFFEMFNLLNLIANIGFTSDWTWCFF